MLVSKCCLWGVGGPQGGARGLRGRPSPRAGSAGVSEGAGEEGAQQRLALRRGARRAAGQRGVQPRRGRRCLGRGEGP